MWGVSALAGVRLGVGAGQPGGWTGVAAEEPVAVPERLWEGERVEMVGGEEEGEGGPGAVEAAGRVGAGWGDPAPVRSVASRVEEHYGSAAGGENAQMNEKKYT